MQQRTVYDLREPRLPPSIGNKAENLRFLIRHKCPVPATWVCTWDAYLDYLSGDPGALERLRTELTERVQTGRPYAVRSSANVEDDAGHSFAGQFQTYLGVQGIDGVLKAVESVWRGTRSPEVQAYLERHAIPADRLRMAVIMQEMVEPRIAGVAFSKNPMTGLSEVIVEAVEGSGEALVQAGATPRRWANKWGAWLQKPEDDGIPLALIEQVVRETKSIAKSYGKAADLEWVYDGDTLFWVQLREITALDIPVYSNRIAKEVLPGIIKPLIWSVNVPLVNGAWVRLLTELIGPNDIDPLNLAGHFYYRAYFNMGALGRLFELLGTPPEVLELMMGLEAEGPEKPSFRFTPKTYALLPRVLRFGLDKVRFEHRLRLFLASKKHEFRGLCHERAQDMSEAQLLDAIDQNYGLAQETAYYNIVVPLLAMIFNRTLKGLLSAAGVDYQSVDLSGGMPGMEQFDPGLHLARLHKQYLALAPDLQALVEEGGYEELRSLPEAVPLLRGVDQFLDEFGHFSDSGNDFSATPWRENPDLILDMVASYSREDRGAEKRRFEDLELSPLRRSMARSVLRRAQRFRLHREAVSSLYTYGYGLFRVYFLALGDRFVQRGILKDRDDIFYLYLSEVREIVKSDLPDSSYQERVAQRRAEIEQVRDIALPETIYGSQAPPVVAATDHDLRGIATSRGHYTGRVKILQGIHDFAKMQAGDVLVIPYSEVGWTPLFAKAGAVIAESGGILSHSSIVAREYGIPAVVSVVGACRLRDNALVTVDGYRGQVIVHETR